MKRVGSQPFVSRPRPAETRAVEAAKPVKQTTVAEPIGQVEALRWGEAKKSDRTHDGHFLGADGKFYAPETPLENIPPILPDNGKEASELIIEINGIMTPGALHQRTLQALANTGARVIGVHNATSGMLSDLAQTVMDKLDWGKNPAVDTVNKVLWDALEKGQSVRFAGHSQGAVIIARALVDAKNRMLLEKGMTPDEVTQALRKVTVETFGGAATSFLDGPQYRHMVNRWDLIPWVSGVGGSDLHPFSRPGKGATVRVFSDVQKPRNLPELAEGVLNLFARTVDRSIHGPVEVYYKDREP